MASRDETATALLTAIAGNAHRSGISTSPGTAASHAAAAKDLAEAYAWLSLQMQPPH